MGLFLVCYSSVMYEIVFRSIYMTITNAKKIKVLLGGLFALCALTLIVLQNQPVSASVVVMPTPTPAYSQTSYEPQTPNCVSSSMSSSTSEPNPNYVYSTMNIDHSQMAQQITIMLDKVMNQTDYMKNYTTAQSNEPIVTISVNWDSYTPIITFSIKKMEDLNSSSFSSANNTNYYNSYSTMSRSSMLCTW
jgi:hypothetical protein